MIVCCELFSCQFFGDFQPNCAKKLYLWQMRARRTVAIAFKALHYSHLEKAIIMTLNAMCCYLFLVYEGVYVCVCVLRIFIVWHIQNGYDFKLMAWNWFNGHSRTSSTEF